MRWIFNLFDPKFRPFHLGSHVGKSGRSGKSLRNISKDDEKEKNNGWGQFCHGR